LAAVLDGSGVLVAWDNDFPGFRRFYVDDPFGNRLEFMEQLAPVSWESPAVSPRADVRIMGGCSRRAIRHSRAL
jgi:hypothetical protein